MAINVFELTATLYFTARPLLDRDALISAWGLEGYTCEVFENHSDPIAVLRGGCGVFLGDPRPADLADYPQRYPFKLDIDFTETFLIDPGVAFEDFQRCSFEAPLTVRVATDDSRVAMNEFLIVLLGIRQVLAIEAAWLDHAKMFVGKADLEEFTNYLSTQPGMPPPATPEPLVFATNFFNAGSTNTGQTHGLSFLGKPEIIFESDSLSMTDVARVIFNVGVMVMRGSRMKPGESLNVGDIFCRIEAAEVDGVAAFRLREI